MNKENPERIDKVQRKWKINYHTFVHTKTQYALRPVLFVDWTRKNNAKVQERFINKLKVSSRRNLRTFITEP